MKYLMRSDIMFERDAPPVIDEKEKEGMKFLGQAEQAERRGEFKLAVEFYQKAFKLWPPLQEKC